LSRAPDWLALVLTIGFANAAAIGITLAIRRWSAAIGVTSGSPVVNSWATAAGALTALLFAFTIVTVWNAESRARTDLSDEASSLRFVARDLDRSQLPMLRTYLMGTIAEWPQLCGGTPDRSVDAALNRLERLAKPRSQAYANDLFRQLGVAEDLRNRRWQAASAAIPPEIWVGLMLLSCALFTVLGSALHERRAVHLLLMVAVATAIGTLFWVSIVLEYPFCGSTAIPPDALMSVARAHLM
jgi:hypothetical protein